EGGPRTRCPDPRPQVRRDLRRRLAGEILDRVEYLGLPGTLATELSDEDGRVRLQPTDPIQMAVDVERRELDRPVETGVAPERAADIQADHECRPGRLGTLRRGARCPPEGEHQRRGAAPPHPPPR